MCHKVIPIFVLASLATGCTPPLQSPPQASATKPSFKLTEDTAMQRLMGSAYVAALVRAIPSRHLMCMVEITRPDSIDLYLGDDEGDHTTRVNFCRVSQDGRVWVNQDETGLDDRWAVVE